ncbi:MAG: hypothetical protein H6619_02855 [Deltaproteobacteria bacterium]|nr:hypothetical protein [Deltaproteobacteria bacterium]
MNKGSKKRIENERGSYLLSVAGSISVLVFLVFGAIDFVTYSKYTSGAQWLAIIAARISMAEVVNDGNLTAPNANQLKLPVNSTSYGYLRSFCTNPSKLDQQIAKTVNLVLGEADRLFDDKIKTAFEWDGQISSLKEGEIVVLPRQCQDPTAAPISTNKQGENCEMDTLCMQWDVCVKSPTILLPSQLHCAAVSSKKVGIPTSI